jgi:hypothetical protein
MKTIHHDARGPEETVHDLSPVVPARPASGKPQRACGNPDCQTTRRQKTQANWRNRNPGYSIAWRIDQRAEPKPRNRFDCPRRSTNSLGHRERQFGSQDFIGVMGALIDRERPDPPVSR